MSFGRADIGRIGRECPRLEHARRGPALIWRHAQVLLTVPYGGLLMAPCLVNDALAAGSKV